MHPTKDSMDLTKKINVAHSPLSKCVAKPQDIRVKTFLPDVSSGAVRLLVASGFISQHRMLTKILRIGERVALGLNEDDCVRTAMQQNPVHDMPQVTVSAQIVMLAQWHVAQRVLNR